MDGKDKESFVCVQVTLQERGAEAALLNLENNRFGSSCAKFGEVEGFCAITWSHSLFHL